MAEKLIEFNAGEKFFTDVQPVVKNFQVGFKKFENFSRNFDQNSNKMTSIVNVKVKHIRPLGYDNLKEWMKDPNNIYIDRRGIVFIDKERYPKRNSIWANSYKIGKDGYRHEVIEKAIGSDVAIFFECIIVAHPPKRSGNTGVVFADGHIHETFQTSVSHQTIALGDTLAVFAFLVGRFAFTRPIEEAAVISRFRSRRGLVVGL